MESYYVGVGVAKIGKKNSADWNKIAENNARARLAESIIAQVNSEVRYENFETTSEGNKDTRYKSTSSFNQETTVKSDVILPGVVVKDRWIDEKRKLAYCYVIVRVADILNFQNKNYKIISEAIAEIEAKRNVASLEKDSDEWFGLTAQLLKFLLESSNKSLISAEHKTAIGSKVEQEKTHIVSIFSEMSMKDAEVIDLPVNTKLDFEVRTSFFSRDRPMAGMSIGARFAKGMGQLTEELVTNKDGGIELKIFEVLTASDQNIIEFSPEVYKGIGRKLIRSLPQPPVFNMVFSSYDPISKYHIDINVGDGSLDIGMPLNEIKRSLIEKGYGSVIVNGPYTASQNSDRDDLYMIIDIVAAEVHSEIINRNNGVKKDVINIDWQLSKKVGGIKFVCESEVTPISIIYQKSNKDKIIEEEVNNVISDRLKSAVNLCAN